LALLSSRPGAALIQRGASPGPTSYYAVHSSRWMATSTIGQQYWHAPVRCARCNVPDMEGLVASVVLIATLLGVLLVVGGLVYLLARRLPRRSPGPPRKPVNRRIGIGWVIMILLIIGLWAGIKSASSPRPQPAGQPTCPAGPIWGPLQGLCQQL
jgi:hypothetical protein